MFKHVLTRRNTNFTYIFKEKLGFIFNFITPKVTLKITMDEFVMTLYDICAKNLKKNPKRFFWKNHLPEHLERPSVFLLLLSSSTSVFCVSWVCFSKFVSSDNANIILVIVFPLYWNGNSNGHCKNIKPGKTFRKIPKAAEEDWKNVRRESPMLPAILIAIVLLLHKLCFYYVCAYYVCLCVCGWNSTRKLSRKYSATMVIRTPTIQLLCLVQHMPKR